MMDSSQSYIFTEKSSNPTHNARLLWRGSLINPTGSTLHGLAIVAHSMNPKTINQTKHDPFASDSHSHSLSDKCLEIEMLRGRDLQVDQLIQLTLNSRSDDDLSDQEEQIGSRKSRVASLLKGGGNGSNNLNRQIPFSEINCDPEVRLYVDPRCSQTHNWILSQLEKRELTSAGFTSNALIVRLDSAADDQISSQLIIFGRAVEQNLPQSSSSDAIIPLQLVIGQRKPPPSQLIPRPDDPLPRDKHRIKTFITHLGNNTTRTSSSQTRNSSLGNLGKAAPDTTQLVRPDILNHLAPNSYKRSTKPTKRAANTPGRRIKPQTSLTLEDSGMNSRTRALECLSPRRSEKRKPLNISFYSTKKVKTSSQTTNNEHEFLGSCTPLEQADGMDSDNDFPVERSPSPSPFRSQPQADNSMNLIPDQLIPLAAQLDKQQPGGFVGDSSQISKTSRVRFLSPDDSSLKSRPTNSNSKEKPSTELLPTIKQDLSTTSYLHQNKMMIRKITSESLNNRGLYKHDSKFKDLLTAVCRGVQFAVREASEKQSIDINLAKTFVESHLAMYMIFNNNTEN